MSTATQALQVSERENELNQSIAKGDFIRAFNKYYGDNVVRQENDAAPVTGKDVNRKKQEEFMKSLEQFHSAKLLGEAMNGDLAFSEWEYDLTIKGRGRTKLNEVAVRQWKHGQVVRERFYYNAM